MGFQTDLQTGVAQDLLAGKGVGVYRATSAYTAGETGILHGTLPSSPDRVIVLSTYVVDDDPSLSDSVIGLQVTTRWGGQDPRPNDDLADAVFDQLHGLEWVELSTGIRIVNSFRRSGSSLGQDSNSRWRTAQNFYVTCHRPSPNRS